MELRSVLAAVLACVCLLPAIPRADAARVAIGAVEATHSERPHAGLMQVIDGRDTGPVGWSVFPKTGEPHSLLLKAREPVQAQAFDLTLCFLSGQAMRYFGVFSFAITSDPKPSLKGQWKKVDPLWFTATGTMLSRIEDGRLRSASSDTMIGDAIFQIRIPGRLSPVTGFRVDVFPFQTNGESQARVAWNEFRDFCLTEFRIEAIQSNSSNIALGRPVSASHPLWAGLSAGVLTDGLPGSFNHPADPSVSGSFHFQVDLGATRRLDHLAFRSRADGYGGDRMTRLRLRLFDEAPGEETQPVWEGMLRPDGTSPGPGEVDVIRARDGEGEFRGRYLRISSESEVALSPQIAEVEAYPLLTPAIATIRADGSPLATENPVAPPQTKVLRVTFAPAAAGVPFRPPLRWRLRGLHPDWHLAGEAEVEMNEPPPGRYHLEAQFGHSDREWDESMLSLPIEIRAPIWREPAFRWGAAALLGGIGLLILRAISRRREERRMAALRYQNALAEERTRIARDMHDEVGARLSQLALMQDLLARQHPLPEPAAGKIRALAVTTRQAVDALDQVVWAVNPSHDTLAGVAEYLSHTAATYLTPLEIQCRLDFPFDLPHVEVRAQTRHQLILAFRETLQNIAKHSGADSVSFSMRFDANAITLTITDNGRGLPADASGLTKDGLRNMKSRLESIDGGCEIAPGPAGGTQVRMWAPLGPSLPSPT